MPHPPQINQGAILAVARQLLEDQGEAGVVMREVARRLGVSAPSLYFHVASRDVLLNHLIERGLIELGEAMAESEAANGPRACGHSMAVAYLGFAQQNQQLFSLIFAPCSEGRPMSAPGSDPASAVLLANVARFVPAEDVVPIAQVLWSLVHGFATLIVAGQFGMPGDPAAALHRGIDLLMDGLETAR